MRIHFNRGNEYFDTYHIHDDAGKHIGILEDHCRGVKKPYYVGWRKKENGQSWETETFDIKEDAINFAIREETKNNVKQNAF